MACCQPKPPCCSKPCCSKPCCSKSCCSKPCCRPPLLSSLCNMEPCFRPTMTCSAAACCSPCLRPCAYLPPRRPLPATACVTVCSVCRPPPCPQPCKLCPLVRCSKMLFVAPPQRRGYARYCPPTSALPRRGGGCPLRVFPPYGIAFKPPMRFSLSNGCCRKCRDPAPPTPKKCCYRLNTC